MCLTEFDEVKYAEQLREDGKEEGIDIGREEGREEGTIKTLVGFIKDGFISEDTAAKRANMPLSDFRKAVALYCN